MRSYGAVQAKRGGELQGTPKLPVPMTSELGCVTPYIIVPAKFSEQELRHHASIYALPSLPISAATAFRQRFSSSQKGGRRGGISRDAEEEISQATTPTLLPGDYGRYHIVRHMRPWRVPPSMPLIRSTSGPYGEPFGPRLLGLSSICQRAATGKMLQRSAASPKPFCPVLAIANLSNSGKSKEDVSSFLLRLQHFATEGVRIFVFDHRCPSKCAACPWQSWTPLSRP